jgi:predicted peptidase
MYQGLDAELWNDLKARFAPSRIEMLKSGQLTLNNRTMKFTYQTKGERPPNGYTLVFGFHGGGGCPVNVNDQQYNNHKNLYNQQLPTGTIWFTPRSCEDEWDMWFKDYLEDYILEIIRAFCLNDLVDVNKVFITGYSAGGDGVYHLAPRMADYLAGAAMCAGHPNNINLMNVRNINFAIQVGEKDNPYNRVNEAIKYSRMLSQLKQNYGGF